MSEDRFEKYRLNRFEKYKVSSQPPTLTFEEYLKDPRNRPLPKLNTFKYQPSPIPEPGQSWISSVYDFLFRAPAFRVPERNLQPGERISLGGLPALATIPEDTKAQVPDWRAKTAQTMADIFTTPGAALPAFGKAGLATVGASMLTKGAEELTEGDYLSGALNTAFGALGLSPALAPRIINRVRGPEQPRIAGLLTEGQRTPIITPPPKTEVPEFPLKLWTKHVIPGKPPIIIERGTNRVVTFGPDTNWPANVVPIRTKPVTPEESAFNALVPNRYKVPGTEIHPEGTMQNTIPAGRLVSDQYEIVPGTPDKIHLFEKQLPARMRNESIERASRPNPAKDPTRFDPDFVPPPQPGDKTTAIALRQKYNKTATLKGLDSAPDEVINQAVIKKNQFQVFKDLFMPIERQLERMGPAGKEISRTLALASQEARQLASRWDRVYNQIEKSLTKEEIQKFFDAMDTGIVPPDPKIRKAVALAKKVDDERIQAMQKYGLVNPETGEAMKFRANYAPRIWPEEFWRDPNQIYAALIQRYPTMDKETARQIALGIGGDEIIDRVMRSSGVDSETARKIVRIGLEKSERKISPQYARELDLPGFRKDINVWREHNWEIAKKIAEQKHFGRLDIADPNSPLSKLVAQTPNPRLTEDLLRVHLSRIERDRFARNMDRVADFAGWLSSALYLSNFRITNLGGLNPIGVVAGQKNLAKSLVEVAITNRGATREFAEESGAIYNITKGILEGLSETKLDKLYGISSSENLLRTIAANAGRLAAQDLFATLKSGRPLKASDAKLLEDLFLAPIDEISKWKSIPENKLKLAGGRMAEITQGLPEPRKLPSYFSNPYVRIPMIFKRYAVQQSWTLFEHLKRNPSRIPAYVATSQLLGEIIGGSKAALRGLPEAIATGDPNAITERIAKRGEHMSRYTGTENLLINRAIDNIVNSWMLGVVADLMLASVGGRDALLRFIAGPFATTMTDLGSNIGQAISGNPEPLFRQGLRAVPFVGYGLQEYLVPTQQQQRKP